MITLFKDLKIGSTFDCNGNKCLKVSTKTAKILAFDRVFYYHHSESVDNVEYKEIIVLSIDAWRDGGSWQWNQWYKTKSSLNKFEFDKLDSNRKILKWCRKEGLLSAGSIGKVSIEDDQHNIVIVAKNTREPLFAIPYAEFLLLITGNNNYV